MTGGNPNRVTVIPAHWLKMIDKMLDSGDYDFAKEFLESVREYVEENDRITKKQREAVMNVRRSKR